MILLCKEGTLVLPQSPLNAGVIWLKRIQTVLVNILDL